MTTRNTKIEPWRAIAPEALSGKHYLESLLQAGTETGLLTQEDADGVRLRVLELLTRRCALYQSGSSSIREEAAAHILESTLFTLGAACKRFPNADAAALALKTADLTELFTQGRSAISSTMRRTKQLWLLVLSGKTQTMNDAYSTTFSEKSGIGTFFGAYEMEFSAQAIPCDVDYPLYQPVEDRAGVDFIRQFLANALCENQFCAYFSAEVIGGALRAHDKRCDSLLVNVFGIVLRRALGCVLAGQDPIALKLSEEDLAAAHAKLSDDPLKALESAARDLLRELDCHGSVEAYVCASLPGVVTEIQYAIRCGAAERAFL